MLLIYCVSALMLPSANNHTGTESTQFSIHVPRYTHVSVKINSPEYDYIVNVVKYPVLGTILR